MKKLIVTGSGGLLGSHLVRLAQGRFETLGLLRKRLATLPGPQREVDLVDEALLDQTVRSFRPHVVIHAGAITAPVACENDPEQATLVNVRATAQLAERCAELGTRFIFLSTDLVFDGNKGMYREDDAVAPSSHYGQTKVLAEEETRRRAPNHVIARTSLMVGYSPRGNRAVNEIMKLAADRGERMPLFVDEYRCLIGAANLAEVLLEFAERSETGTFHVVGPERRSRAEWGLLIARHFGWEQSLIKPTRRADVPCMPPRPPDVSLDISKATNLLRTRIKSIPEVLHELSG